MSYSYLVVGSGIGKAIARWLAEQSDTELVTIVDRDKALLKIAPLFDSLDSKKIQYIVSDIDKLNQAELFKEFDVIISALPARKNVELAFSAITAGVNFCDLGGVLEITRKIKNFHELAVANRVSIVPDCGLMPGDGNIIAQDLIYQGYNYSAQVLVGGLPQNPQPPLFHSNPYSIEGLRHICFDKALVLKNGEVQFAKALSEYEEMMIPELAKFSDRFKGRAETFVTAGTSTAPELFQKQGLQDFSELTIRWPGFVKFVKTLTRDNFIEVMTPLLPAVNASNPDLVYMEVTASGYKGDQVVEKSVRLLDLFDHQTELTAMERTTGFSAAIMARMIAQGKIEKGVFTPESALNREGVSEFCNELKKYFKITES